MVLKPEKKTLLSNPLYLFGLLFLLIMTCKPANQEAKQPNIIILFADDLGYGDLGCYGHPTIRTPNLDKMAADGIKFTSYYSGSPACTASRYALLTGRYPIRSGFSWVLYPKSERGIHSREYTLAEGLKDAGYATACFGKWHLGSTQKAYLPLQNGFDEYFGLPYSNDMIPPKWEAIPLFEGNDTLELNPDQGTLTRRYTERAVAFIKKNKKNPFFLYLPYAMPHLPLHPGKSFAGKSKRGKYGDVVEEIDWSVGQILQVLEENGMAKNTLVIFTSDNGPWIIKNQEGGSAGLLRDGKGSTWEGGMRVPMIASWKGTIGKNQVTDAPVSTLDVYTSLLKIAGQSLPEHINCDGRDISSLFTGRGAFTGDKAFFYYGPKNLHAARKGSWKLHIRTSSQTGKDYFDSRLPLLFNVDEDPSEEFELSENHPEIVAELLGIIENHRQTLEAQPSFYQQENAD